MAVLLRDYLLDDLSSCSSNGFKSFPRRHCCTSATVRFLLDFDLKASTDHKKPLASRTAAAAVTALQRVSVKLFNAVKQLPFPSAKSPSKKGIVSRTFSRKLLKRSFWRKSGRREIGRWTFFHVFVDEERQSSDQISTNSNSKGSRDGNGGSGSEFLLTRSGNDAVSKGRVSEEKKVIIGRSLGARVGEDSVGNSGNNAESGKEWSKEGKEQSSPVSVLDCPFEDEEEIDQSTGTIPKLMQKVKRFERGLADQLKPLDLDKRIASMSENNRRSGQAKELLDTIKASSPLFTYNAKNLLLDYFVERMDEENGEDLLQKAEDWICGRARETLVGWEVKEKRMVYVGDMGEEDWRSFGGELEKVVKELEVDLLTSLVEEILLDF